MSEKTSRKLVGFPMVVGIRHASRRWWIDGAVRPASADAPLNLLLNELDD
jgi:hypothetical protein